MWHSFFCLTLMSLKAPSIPKSLSLAASLAVAFNIVGLLLLSLTAATLSASVSVSVTSATQFTILFLPLNALTLAIPTVFYAIAFSANALLKIKNPWVSTIIPSMAAFLNLLFITLHFLMFFEYGDGINPEISHLFGNDGAVIYNYMKQQYHLHAFLLLFATLAYLYTWIHIRFIHPILAKFISKNIKACGCAIAVCLVTGGCLAWAAPQFPKYTIKTLYSGPYMSTLRTVSLLANHTPDSYERHLRPYLSVGETASIQTAKHWSHVTSTDNTPATAFTRTSEQAPFNLKNQPSHIFWIQLEGHDSALLRDPKLTKISPNLHELTLSGIYVPYFFASSHSTNGTALSSLTSLPSLPTSTAPRYWRNKKFPTLPNWLRSNFNFSSSLHSASFYEACDHVEYLKLMGFDSVTTHSDAFPKSKWSTIWGISDRDFVDNILNNHQFPDNHFAMFMTISNHSPYSMDIEAAGFSKSWLPREKHKLFTKGGYDPAQRAGHYWYADQQLKRLIDGLLKKHPKALFIITADHWSRYCSTPDDLLSQHIVPLIIWGPNIIPAEQTGRRDDWFGSHIDLIPTLIHLLSKSPCEYHSYGRPLWRNDKYIHTHNAVGNHSHIYLHDHQLLLNYKTNEQEANSELQRSLSRWWAGINTCIHQFIYNNNQWENQ